jgi:ATP-dependent protease HslVU (ClpYQ) ATPase subunit
MIFTNKYFPKIDSNDQINYLGVDYYSINKPKSYITLENNNYSSSNTYFPSLDYSISETAKNTSSGSDIADVITNDKLKFLGATATHIKSQIDQRSKIRDDHIADLDSKIIECDVGLMNMELWPMFSNPMVERRRADLQNVIQRLEMEKRQEITKCWKDQSPLYKELLETLGEHKNVNRRTKMLSGGF